MTYNFGFGTEEGMTLHGFINSIAGNEGKDLVMALVCCTKGNPVDDKNKCTDKEPYNN